VINRRFALEATLSAVIGAIVSLIALIPALQRITTSWGEGDMLSTYVNVANWGWLSFERTTQFGYPLGMDLNLFPTLDITQNSFAALVSTITQNPFIGINLLLALTFPLVAALAYASIRLTGLRGPIAIALAVAFTIIPYHFGRGLGHTYLATLYAAVTGLILAQLIGMGRIQGLLTKGTRSRRIRNASLLAVLVFLTAWSGVYYAAFGLLLMGAAVLYRIALRDSSRKIAWSLLPPAFTALLASVGAIPAAIAARTDPAFAVLSERMPYESVIFAGNLAMAVLPAPISRLPLLAPYNTRVNDAIGAAPAFENTATTNFGTWITLAALAVIAIALFTSHRRRLGLIAVFAATTVLFFVPWGANYLFAALITPQIRAWNRLLPILLFLMLLAAATVLARTSWAKRVAIALPIGLVIVAISAVEVSWPFRTAYADSSRANGEVTQAALDYTAAINTLLPQNCGILQLPNTAYPENGPVREMNDYDHFWVSLVDDEKSWSYGAVKNTRAGAWAQALPQIPNVKQVDVLARAGFCGIHLDTRAYVTPAVDRISTVLSDRYGPPAARGFEDEWLFWITDANATATSPGDWADDVSAFFLAPAVTPDKFTVAPRGSIGDLIWWWTIEPEATFTINSIDDSHPLTSVSGEVRSPSCGPNRIELTLTTQGETVRTVIDAEPRPSQSFILRLNEPTTSQSTLSVRSQSRGCDIADFALPQYAQIIDLKTN
jgi:hypothetical protein